MNLIQGNVFENFVLKMVSILSSLEYFKSNYPLLSCSDPISTPHFQSGLSGLSGLPCSLPHGFTAGDTQAGQWHQGFRHNLCQ